MLSTKDPNYITVFNMFFTSPKCNNTDSISADTLGDGFDGDKICWRVLVHDIIVILCELWVGIGMDWGKVDCVDLTEVVLEG
jgi:hypothetical protein